jgi:salicylate hydroxylase
LAQTLKNWKDGDLGSALQFFQDLRKPRTDRITQTSYETGKLASADIPEEQWAANFNPDMIKERMRWVMEYDLLSELAKGLQLSEHSTAGVAQERDGLNATTPVKVH